MNVRYLTVSNKPSDELLKLLDNNIIGTPGRGMLYQHLQVNEKIRRIENPYFVNLERAGSIAGTCCFCKRTTLNKGLELTSFYVRYFSFKGLFRKRTLSERPGNRMGALRKEVNDLLSGSGLDVTTGEKFFHYAYVDPRNERSATLCKEFGFEPVRQYTTIIFSRLFPNKKLAQKIVEVDAASAQGLLKDFYQEFTMVSFENLPGRKYYFIESDDGQRVAGVQVNRDQWKIHSLPGFLNVALGLFTHLPILNRLISKNFQFLTFENFYWMPGCEKYLVPLLEHLLGRYQVYAGICIVDRDSKLYAALKSLPLGLMSGLNREVTGDVICRFENFKESEKSEFLKSPAFLSGIDAT